MADYDGWLAMARDSYEAGEEAQTAGRLRSATSRFYYAAYQASTALLLYRGLTPPDQREAWSHDLTPDLVSRQLESISVRRDVRFDMRRRLLSLYQRRIKADYQVLAAVTEDAVEAARRDAGYIVGVSDKIMQS